jgi:hypothetical protein
MGQAIIPANASIQANRRDKQKERLLASRLAAMLNKRTFSADLGKKISYADQIERMLVELAATGATTTGGGQTLEVTNVEDWLAMVKFIHNHLDGPVVQNGATFNTQVNVFKVYGGFDPDEL